MTRWLIGFAGVAGFLAVAFGAFGAHALRKKLPEDRMANLELGVRYLYFHIPGVLAVAWLSTLCGGEPFEAVAAWSFVLGMVLFSGSLIVLALTGERRWGRVTPVGGVLLLIGWAALIGAGFAVASANAGSESAALTLLRPC
jgi:uncharacterized membrane protein YgdD (TMEM256/DUF423 family)